MKPIELWRKFWSVVAVIVGYNSVTIAERAAEILSEHPSVEVIIEDIEAI